MSVTSWFLVSSSGTRHRLPREMIFVGRDDCELMVQSRSVDKQHAVLNYDPNTDEHMVKDLGSLNGTFVNDLRIPDQTYITLKLSDIIRFGYDVHVYILEKSQHKVPEEALKHEKYTSQLQLGLKALEGRRKDRPQQQQQQQNYTSNVKLQDHLERKAYSATASTDSPISKPTPLYGQPSWWGEDDDHPGNKQENGGGKPSDQESTDPSRDLTSRHGVNGSLSESAGKAVYSYRREPSYFEIPTRECQQRAANTPDGEGEGKGEGEGEEMQGEEVLQEVPTKDIPDPAAPHGVPSPTTPTQPVVQSHASFTIEFDECTPGKMKIKDHITKFSLRQQRKFPPKEAVAVAAVAVAAAAAPSEVISAESKVADWLVQSNISMMRRRRSHAEDLCSTKSDQSAQKTTKGHQHEDGTYSDSDKPSGLVDDLIRAQAPIGPRVCQPPQKGSPPQRSSPTRITPPSPGDPLSSSLGSQSPPTLGKSDPRRPLLNDDSRSRRARPEASRRPENARKAAGVGAGAGGERQASGMPVSKRYTVPLRDPDASPGPVRAGSLRREKTEDRISFPSRSSFSSSVSTRPFGSVGRRSKFTQDYTAEFLKQARRSSATAATITADLWDKAPSPVPTRVTPPRTTAEGSPESPPRSPVGVPSPPPPHLVQASSPIHQPIPLKAPLMPRSAQGGGTGHEDTPPAGAGVPRPDEEDNLSDAGTYTIEAETQDKEVEEARSMIDQVFGVLESPEHSHQTVPPDPPASYRPASIECAEQQHGQRGGEVPRPAPEQGEGLVAVVKKAPVSPKWMSRWASLADSYTESEPSPGLVSVPSSREEQPGGGGAGHITILNNTTLGSESDVSRPCRLLPAVPLSGAPTPTSSSGRVRYDLQSTFEVADSSSASGDLPGSSSPDSSRRSAGVQDDLDPDSLSDDDASRSDHSSVVETRRTPPPPPPLARLPAPPTSFYVGSEEEEEEDRRRGGGSSPATPTTERKSSPKLFSTATLTKQRGAQDGGKLKANVSAPTLDRGRSPSPGEPESRRGVSLMRHESFTMDSPSDARLPNISRAPASGEPVPEDESVAAFDQDTRSYLKDTEDVLASLEAKLQAFQPSPVTKPPSAIDSLSTESDLDTSSTVSHHSNKPNSLSPHTTVPTNGIHTERSSASTASQESNHQSSASEQLSETPYSRGSEQGGGRAQRERGRGRGPVGLRRIAGKRDSVDLSDDAQGSSLPCSDQESGSHGRRKYTVPLKKDEAKPSRATQALSRSSSLSAPRATRASMLRRARLGDASDNEGPETERPGQDAAAAARQPQEAKRLTRLDMLAMPRKRTSSFNTPSDTEAGPCVQVVPGRTTGFSNRSTESGSGSGRKASVPGPKPAPQKGALTNTPITRGRSSSAKYTSSTASSRRRQKGCDYDSTSEDECDFDEPSVAKHTHKRSQPSPARNGAGSGGTATHGRSRPPPQPMVALRPKKPGRDSEDESHDGEAFHGWSNHSAEIARLSQDLAKDLASLAREIHDVAGEAEPQSSAAEAQVPASNVTAHEELVQRIPEAGLNYQRVPPGPAAPKDPDQDTMDQDTGDQNIGDQDTRDQNIGDQEPSTRSRPHNPEEVIVDNLMLNPVTQISQAIRRNTDQLAGKLKVLFQDRMDLWQEVEAKVSCDNDFPVVKTANKEITSILNELRRVQRQLEVINAVMEPSRKAAQDNNTTTTSASTTASASASTAAAPSLRPATRDWRTTRSASRRAASGHRPGEGRDGYMV